MKSQFLSVTTEDGSPTLKGGSEAMHSQSGAFGESCHVYGRALEDVRSLMESPRICSVGLGLGYCEFLCAVYYEEPRLVSFEKVTELSERFTHWVRGEGVPIYDEIERLFGHKFEFTPGQLRSRLRYSLDEGYWQIRSDIKSDLEANEHFEVMLYDPYSEQTDPELWTESFIESLVHGHMAPKSIFATYAAKGTLNRVLKRSGFEIYFDEGFAKKRGCTLARRRFA